MKTYCAMGHFIYVWYTPMLVKMWKWNKHGKVCTNTNTKCVCRTEKTYRRFFPCSYTVTPNLTPEVML